MARIGTVRFRHPHDVIAVAWSPDGKHLASAGSGNIIHLWDAASGKEVGHMEGVPCQHITSLAWSPDGKNLASASGQIGVQVWNMDTGKQRCQLGKATDDMCFLTFSPDGRWLACTASPGSVRVWDTTTWEEAEPCPGSARYQGVSFSADGKLLVGAGMNGVTKWDFSTRKSTFFKGVEGWTLAVAMSPDGRFVASTNGQSVVVVDPETGKERYRLPEKGTDVRDFWHLRFSPDGKTFAACGRNRPVRVWAAEDGKERCRVDEADGVSWGIEYSPDGRTLAVCTDKVIRLFDSATGKEHLPRGAPSSAISALAFAPNGRTLAVAAGATGGIYDRATLRESVHFSADGRVGTMAFCPDGAALSTSTGHGVQFWDVATGRNTRSSGTPARKAEELGVSETTAVSADFSKLVTWNVGRQTFAMPGEQPKWNSSVAVRAADTGKELARFSRSDSHVSASALSSDGSMLALCGNDGVIRIEHLETKHETELHIEACTGVVFASVGRMVGVSTTKGQLSLCEVANGQERVVLQAHPGRSFSLAFSPDGRSVATWASEGPVIVWDVVRGVERKRFTGHVGGVLSVAFSADGRTLATGGEDTTVLLWDIGEEARLSQSTLTEKQRDDCWATLAQSDARRRLGGHAHARRSVWDGRMDWPQAIRPQAVRSSTPDPIAQGPR